MTTQHPAAGETRETAVTAKPRTFSGGRSTRFSFAAHPDLPKAPTNPDRVGWCSGIED